MIDQKFDVLAAHVDKLGLGQMEIIEVVKRLESGQQAFRSEMRDGLRSVEEKLEKTRTELGGKIDAVTDKVADHETRIVALEGAKG